MRSEFEVNFEILVASYVFFITKYRICELGVER